jgi:hypothetical protein
MRVESHQWPRGSQTCVQVTGGPPSNDLRVLDTSLMESCQVIRMSCDAVEKVIARIGLGC